MDDTGNGASMQAQLYLEERTEQMAENLLKIPEAGARLRWKRAKSYQAARAGVLPTVRLPGGALRVPESALDALIKRLVEEAGIESEAASR